MRIIHNLLKDAAKALGFTVVRRRGRYDQDGLITVHNDGFRYAPAFRHSYQRGVRAGGGVDPKFDWRVHVALWASSSCLPLEGAFVECGVNAGFISSAILDSLQWNQLDREFFLIDTFSGPVKEQYSAAEVRAGRLSIAEQSLAAGAYVTDLERVYANYSEWSNVSIIAGAIPDVLATLSIPRVAFLHIDLNCAYPEVEALRYFWERLSPGAIVLFDDYAYYGHQYQKESIDTALCDHNTAVLSLPTGQGMLIKR